TCDSRQTSRAWPPAAAFARHRAGHRGAGRGRPDRVAAPAATIPGDAAYRKASCRRSKWHGCGRGLEAGHDPRSVFGQGGVTTHELLQNPATVLAAVIDGRE